MSVVWAFIKSWQKALRRRARRLFKRHLFAREELERMGTEGEQRQMPEERTEGNAWEELELARWGVLQAS